MLYTIYTRCVGILSQSTGDCQSTALIKKSKYWLNEEVKALLVEWRLKYCYIQGLMCKIVKDYYVKSRMF